MRCGSNKVINAHDMRQDITGQKGETQEARRHQSLSHPVSTGTSILNRAPHVVCLAPQEFLCRYNNWKLT
ncbi:Uncharacterized protein HZ326_23894 [Fusarium oxysporum f. sp. albedinis]|nr:Uncharacterized protein HZ326_23894 [Fusarium oxysporum f. sp. albedinis]